MLTSGNTDGTDGLPMLMSYPARRKVHSDYKLKDRTDLCYMKDARNFKDGDNYGNYIQSIHETNYYKKSINPPLFTSEIAIHLCYEPALMLLKKFPQSFAYFDATGSIVEISCCREKNNHHQSRILNHILVVRFDELNLTIPIFEAISSMSNTDAIVTQLKEFLNILRALKIQWCFKYFVVDWCKPYFHALSEVFNQMSFIDYLNTLYEGKTLQSKTKSYILSCVSHFTHMVSRNCQKMLSSENYHLKSKIVEIFCLFINCTTIHDVKKLIYFSVILFKSKYASDLFVNMKKDLNQLIEIISSKEFIKVEPLEENTSECEEFITKETISKNKISFYNVFLKIKQTALVDMESAKNFQTTNIFYDADDVFMSLLDEYIGFVIIWSRILYFEETDKHVSNAIVENHNKTIKNAWIGKCTKVRPVEYIRTSLKFLDDMVESANQSTLLKSFWEGKKQRQKKKVLPPTINKNVLCREQEESYQKKNRQHNKYTHFRGKNLKKEIKKIGTQNTKENKENMINDSVILIDDEEESTLISEFISQEYSESTKSIIRQNAFSLKCAPCGIVLENKYYSGSTLMFLKHKTTWLHYDDFITIEKNNRLEVSLIEFYLKLVVAEHDQRFDINIVSMTETAKIFAEKSFKKTHFQTVSYLGINIFYYDYLYLIMIFFIY